MKFGDKLIKLRKKNGYSQEELAEKLGVSRQSVSKWESNNTYPETDKIIQIANLFDCSMDDLINDKITDVDSSLRKNKNVYNIWDSLLEFITKTINMFSNMTFKEGFKCIIEMIVIGFLLSILGNIICNTASSIISSIFSFIGNDFEMNLKSILNSIFNLIWFIVTIIVIIYTLKIRYLNDYEIETIKINNDKKNDNNDSIIHKQEVKIIRHENEKPYAFLSILSKIVIFFIKLQVFFILIGITLVTIGFIIGTVMMLSLISINSLFIWISLLLISCTIISIQMIVLIIHFLFNKKVNVKVNIIIFIISIILFGFSTAFTILTFKNIEIINDDSLLKIETKEIRVEYKDFMSIKTYNNQKYIIDNNITDNEIIVSKKIDSKFFKLDTNNTTNDMLPVLNVCEKNNASVKDYYNFFIENLKNNKIYTFSNYGNYPYIIKANENTINNLINNLKKLYLVEEKINGNEIDITLHNDKVYFPNGLDGEYDARDDSIKYENDNYSCKKEIESTPYGERIIYTCDYKEEE